MSAVGIDHYQLTCQPVAGGVGRETVFIKLSQSAATPGGGEIRHLFSEEDADWQVVLLIPQPSPVLENATGIGFESLFSCAADYSTLVNVK